MNYIKAAGALTGFVLLALFCFTASAQAQIQIEGTPNPFALSYWVDSSAAIADFERLPDPVSFEQESEWLGVSPGWHPASDSSLNFGIIPDAVWLKLELGSTPEPTPRLLEIANHKITDLSAFVIKKRNGVSVIHQTLHLSDKIPISQRPYPSRHFVFPIELTPQTDTTIYFRVQNFYPMKLPISLWSPVQLERQNESRILFQGIYFGVVLIMAIYNLCIYFFVKDKSYGTYSLFILCLAGFIMVDRGLAIQYLWPENPGLDFQMAIFFTALGSAISVPFTIHFLSLHTHAPKIASALRYLCALWIIITVLSVIYPPDWLLYLVVALLPPGSVTLLAIGVLMWKKGVPAAPYYTTAWFVLIAAIAVFDAYLVGWLPVSIFTEYSLQAGNMIEVTLLSLGLAYRIKSLDREKREADLLSQTKSEFLATMSHEIRTPMNGILGMAELLRDTKLNTQQSTYLNTILSSGTTLMTVLNDILDFSKIDAGRLELEEVSFNIRRLVDDTAGVFAMKAPEKNLFYNVYISPRVPARILGDPVRLRQILTNLISNAFKFTLEGEVILYVDSDREGGKIRFKVCDSGIGIAPDKYNTIFEQFTQAERATSRHFGGTGLGLTICKSFIELMGGEIGLESKPGAGSTFWFQLPLKEAVPFGSVNESDLAAKARDLDILLVSPDTRFIEQIEDYQQIWHFNMVTAPAVHQTITLCNGRTKPFQFIMLDQYCEDFSAESFNKLLIKQPWAQQSQFMLAVKPGFDRSQLNSNESPLSFEEFPVSITRLQLKMGEIMGFSKLVQSAPKAQKLLKQARVLVVDDNPVNTLVVTGYLRKLGIEPSVAETGSEALTIVFNSPTRFDLILMDCEMPLIDGYQATRDIRQWESDNGFLPQPICALSAHAMAASREKCFSSGMNGFLSKPIVFPELKATLEQYCIA
ncbi:response regulator [Ketobacter sp. MCCC 1A13808]|uniref:hybrid sensor histidine kinase/response regulator n=1 Tax=Ketobacter sp. MCCC 1A13808 TaxID=2602738 RepID=UPI0012EB6E00|nr:hybrid sensor histidine kinase/response regulator [Ketobacter sp. MCCC 1A13808]MVF10766.1 response regulator [Ketobacter sp. MCCC 1A13808]